ncbi:E3 ubiquitin-protein ligase TRIM21 [Oryzias melastigma]|uniref:Bloodthirsty-related gene family, member 1 n=1 Tax=Oryzias melastigma TaxID=30732 RepID=A0A3B3DZ03_ORYME|nr:E3 ubiquitin-protein ligase TRIM21 [Oryzias melastigma]
MSLPGSGLCEDQFTCSICLDLFDNPVSTPCGHSFCQSCISSYWDGKGGGAGGGRAAKPYHCPLCKESFRRRPELHINRTLKEITEQFKQMANSTLGGEGVGQVDPPTPRQVTPVEPDGSYDPPPPYIAPPRVTPRRPSDVSPNLPLCPIHMRGLELFCRTDNICICSLCMETAGHRGHNVVTAMREWQIKKTQIGIADTELRELIVERERKVEEVQNSIREIEVAAERETEGTVFAFAQLISILERCQSDVLEVIEMTLRSAQVKAQSLLKELKEDIDMLKKKSLAMNRLADSEDYITFLKSFPALATPTTPKTWTNISVSSQLTSGVVLKNVNLMMNRLQEEIRKLPEICRQSTSTHLVPRPNPRVKRVQEYAENITLDPKTAHPRLIISADGKQVRCTDHYQGVLDYPERFDRVVCVMAHQGFNAGRHYWEVEVGEKTDWDLGVASHSVNRKGKITASPANGYWFLSLRDRTEYVFRTDPATNLSVNIRPSRIGIYLDCDKGMVSFYNAEAKVLIYTYSDSFPDTIHPFFSPCTNMSGQNEAPLVVCPLTITH